MRSNHSKLLSFLYLLGVTRLQELLQRDELVFPVQRENIVKKCLQKYKEEDLTAGLLKVEFVGEFGDDLAVLTIEAFTSFWHEVSMSLFLPLYCMRGESWKFSLRKNSGSHSFADSLPTSSPVSGKACCNDLWPNSQWGNTYTGFPGVCNSKRKIPAPDSSW